MSDEIHQHGRRTAWLTARLCALLDVGANESRDWAVAALTHDIGKQDIPSAVLAKPGALDAAERMLVQRHCVDGARRLLRLARPDSEESTTAAVAVALSHHEWWDGSGYPFGLSGIAIPRCARIVAVADVVDALTSARAYKPAWALDAALEEIAGRRGGQFQPECVDAMEVLARTLRPDWRSQAQAWGLELTLELSLVASVAPRAAGAGPSPVAGVEYRTALRLLEDAQRDDGAVRRRQKPG
jgi:HD-GYP domain-containing protein (c-di-GMP phosphodiesterase class II)